MKRSAEIERKTKYQVKKKQDIFQKENSTGIDFGSYIFPKTFGKALMRINRLLPKTPLKKAAIIRKFVLEALPNESFILFNKTNLDSKKKMFDDMVQSAEAFYIRDDIRR